MVLSNFNINRLVNVSGTNNNCGPNVFVHAFIDNFEKFDFTKDPFKEIIQLFIQNYASDPSQFKNFSTEQFISILREMNYYDQELVLGPIIRQHMANVLTSDAHYNEVREMRERLPALNEGIEMFSADELIIYAKKLNIDAAIYTKNEQGEVYKLAEAENVQNPIINLNIYNESIHWWYQASNEMPPAEIDSVNKMLKDAPEDRVCSYYSKKFSLDYYAHDQVQVNISTPQNNTNLRPSNVTSKTKILNVTQKFWGIDNINFQEVQENVYQNPLDHNKKLQIIPANSNTVQVKGNDLPAIVAIIQARVYDNDEFTICANSIEQAKSKLSLLRENGLDKNLIPDRFKIKGQDYILSAEQKAELIKSNKPKARL